MIQDNKILKGIEQKLDELKEGLLIKEPNKFSKKDLLEAFFGALIMGLTFSIKGLLVQVSSSLGYWHTISIILSTLVILTVEIQFIGYARVRKKQERKFGQFWLKRIVAFYAISLMVSLSLIYLFGLNNLPQIVNDPISVFKLVVMLSMPCAIGAAIADLMKKY